MPRFQRRLGYCLAAVGLAAIAPLTLIPSPAEAALALRTPVRCIICGDVGGVDFLLNILLFVPLGIGLGLAGFSWRRAAVLAALLSCGIELLQMKVIAGRDASLGDVLTNTMGGGIGALLGAQWKRLIFPQPSDARRMALATALTLTAIWAGTARALAPMWPSGAPWYGQWAADLGHLELFLGTPLTVSASGEPLLPGPALDQGRLKDALAAAPEISIRAILGTPTAGLAPIASIYDRWEREVILLGQDQQDLEFRFRTHAVGMRLRSPIAALPNGLSGQPGDTVEATGALRDGAYELTARNGKRTTSRTLPLSASWGWSLVLPWDYALGGEVHFVTALWIAVLLGVLAFWGALAGGSARAIAPVTAGVLLAAVPFAADFRPAHLSEWAGALVGILLGFLCSRRAAGARPRGAELEYNEEPTTQTEAIS